MPIPFTCPHCGAETDVAEEYAGQSGPCAACGEMIFVPPLAGAPSPAAPTQGSRAAIVVVVVILLAVVIGGLLVCGGAYFWGISRSRVGRGPGRPRCINNLKQIGVAMHNYHDSYGCFPPAYIPDENGKPMHSWRVLLLPFMEQEMLYQQYNFDEPWDSPTNLALTDMIPQVYRCPGDTTGRYGETSYVMIVGPETISDGPTARKITDIKDGTFCTIMVVEVANSGIDWMEPRDLKAEDMTFAINDGTPEGIRSGHPKVANILLCDGTVHTVPDTTDPARIRAMSTIAGGEEVSRSFEGF